MKRTLHVATEHKLLTKFEEAGLNEKLAQLIIESKNNALVQKIVDFIREETNLTIWGTIINGAGPKTSQGFQEELVKSAIHYSKSGKGILFQPDFESSISSKSQRVNLCVKKTEDILGQEGKKGTTQEIYAGIEKIGGYLLTPESGPNILLQLRHQIKDKWILVAMNPIENSNGVLGIFRLGWDVTDRLWLEDLYDSPNHGWYQGWFWAPDTYWVFGIHI